LTNCISRKDNYSAVCYEQAAALPQEWHDMLPADHFLHPSQLSVTEAAMLPDVSFLYILLYEKDKPVAASYFQILQVKEKHLNIASLKPLQKIGWKAFAFASPKLLVAGHLFRHDVASFYWSENMSMFDVYRLYKLAIDTALGNSCSNAVLVKDTPEALVPYFQNYAPKYILLRNDISMEMDIPDTWQSIEDYEKALKHKYAQRFRKIKQAGKDIQVKEFSGQEVKQNKKKLYELYLQVCERQTARIGYLSEDFLPLLKEYYGESLKVWGMFHDEEMVGFFSAWEKAAAFDMFYIGFDYNRNASLQLYFNILFFSIEQAIRLKKPLLILGRTALDAKARLGCKPRYLSTFVYIRSRPIRLAVLAIQNTSQQQEGEWEQRHPLKQNK
jgi:hypothetical protein